MAITYLDEPPRSVPMVIIGGGVVGAATAFFARRAGFDPVIIEKRPALCSLTTPASTGAYRLQFDNREELELVRESVGLFLDFQAFTDQTEYDLGVRPQGYLWVTTDEHRAVRQAELVKTQHDWGQTDVEILDGDEVRARWPFVSTEVVQARFRAGDGFLDPRALTMGFVAGAGTPAVVDCAVTGFRSSGNRLTGVTTDRGDISTETVVIAAGPFSGLVAARAGIDLPVETVQRQKIVMPQCPLVPRDAPMTIDDDTGVHWRPALEGAYLVFTDPTTSPTPPTDDVPPDHHRAFQVLNPDSPVAASRVTPFWSEVWSRNSVTWLLHAGQYTMTPDHRPLIGPTGIDGLFVNSGYSGHGIMGSPAGSRHLVDVMAGKLAPETNPFRLDRTFAPRQFDLL